MAQTFIVWGTSAYFHLNIEINYLWMDNDHKYKLDVMQLSLSTLSLVVN